MTFCLLCGTEIRSANATAESAYCLDCNALILAVKAATMNQDAGDHFAQFLYGALCGLRVAGLTGEDLRMKGLDALEYSVGLSGDMPMFFERFRVLALSLYASLRVPQATR